jgi:hypothetical protein
MNMSWTLGKRFTHFRRILETELGAKWAGTDTEFVEYVHRAIPFLPLYLQGDMKAYYIDGRSRDRDSVTGKPTKESSLFYQNLRGGRAALAFFIRAADGNSETVLELVRGE